MPTALLRRAAHIVALVLVFVGLIVTQLLIGGTRPIFSLPGALLIALAGIVGAFAFNRRAPPADRFCLLSTAIFFGYVIARALTSPDAYVAGYDLDSVLTGLLVYGLTALVLTGRRERLVLVGLLLAFALAHVFIGALQFRRGDNFMPIAALQRADYGARASGFYVCPNHLAGLLEVLGVFGLSIVVWSRAPISLKLLTGYAAAVCYAGLVLTGSRGGYGSTGVSLLVFAILSSWALAKGGRRVLLRVGGTAVLVAVLAAVAAATLVSKSEMLTTRAQTMVDTGNPRLDLWRAAIQQWQLAPLFGTGSETYIFYGRKFRSEQLQNDPVEVHNDYLQLLAEYGIACVVAFLLFFGAHLRRAVQTFARLGPKRIARSSRLASNGLALNVAALCAIAAYTVHSALDFNLHIPANVLLLAFVFGVVANPGESREVETTARRGVQPFAAACTLALALIVAARTFRHLPGEYFAERARASLRDEKPAAALQLAERGLASQQNNPWLLLYFARAELALDDAAGSAAGRERALDALQKAHQLSPLDITFTLDLALTYDDFGRFAEAEWMFYEARALDPRSQAVRQLYAAHLSRWRGESVSQSL